jgi:hypothetical protein
MSDPDLAGRWAREGIWRQREVLAGKPPAPVFVLRRACSLSPTRTRLDMMPAGTLLLPKQLNDRHWQVATQTRSATPPFYREGCNLSQLANLNPRPMARSWMVRTMCQVPPCTRSIAVELWRFKRALALHFLFCASTPPIWLGTDEATGATARDRLALLARPDGVALTTNVFCL